MKVEMNTKRVTNPVLNPGKCYRNKANGNLYICADHQCVHVLVNLESGIVWSNKGFGACGPAGWEHADAKVVEV